jgi:hypothetical protein
MRDARGGSQGLALSGTNNADGRKEIPTISSGRLAAVRSRLRSGEVSERKQVGDTESMINEEPSAMQPGGASKWLE